MYISIYILILDCVCCVYPLHVLYQSCSGFPLEVPASDMITNYGHVPGVVKLDFISGRLVKAVSNSLQKFPLSKIPRAAAV